MRTRRQLAAVTLALLPLAGGCGGEAATEAPRQDAPAAAEPRAEAAPIAVPTADRVVAVAREIVAELAAGDFGAVARRVDPERGVRFSASAYVDLGDDPVLSAEEIAAADSTVRRWGYEDGSGEPIEMPLERFVAEWLDPAAFVDAERLAVDRRQGGGNTVDNADEAYPGATIVELHLPGGERYGGLDWKSLRLALVEIEGEWRLVGLIHDSWTI